MMHKPISLQDICLSFSKKTCIEDFSTHIHFGSRVAIIGRNGSGKSSLLKLLQGTVEATSGESHVPNDVIFGYVPQTIEQFDNLSGGQRLNKSLTAALAVNPNVLLLDEPTNHLDRNNRKSLIRNLNSFYGTLIIVTHDTEILRNCVDTLWHCDDGRIIEFSGNYDDYISESNIKRLSIEKNLTLLRREKKEMHTSLMKEQVRAAKSKAKGQKNIRQKKWPTVVSLAKASRSEQTSGRKKAAIDQRKNTLTEELSSIRLSEVIVPKFSLLASEVKNGVLVSVNNGTIAYDLQEPLVRDINFSVMSQDRLAILGNNGCGKSTIIKAILDYANVCKTGCWHMPKVEDIGYLDQHYSNIAAEKSVFESLSDLIPQWSATEVRCHLNDFLFRSNDDVTTLGHNLSGGEKARLSLALIAARPPKLLILDEITNNLDLVTKDHVSQILRDYPAAMIVISHDEDFLRAINISLTIEINNGSINTSFASIINFFSCGETAG